MCCLLHSLPDRSLCNMHRDDDSLGSTLASPRPSSMLRVISSTYGFSQAIRCDQAGMSCLTAMSGDEEDDMMGSYWQLILCGGVLSITSGCITQATLELTKAPFGATTQLANGTTAASSEVTQPLREFTSSTTPGAASINPAKAKKRLQVFTATAYENLRADISRGHGEYLVSLATLAGVPSDSVTRFQSLMQ